MNSPPYSEDPHRWCRVRMLALRRGLLDDPDETRLREHLTSCASCREAYAAVAADQTPPVAWSGHVPSDLIARWPRATATLRGLERAVVRSHLEHCAECRQELELLGHQPVLERVPALEPSDDPTRPVESTREHSRKLGEGEAPDAGEGIEPEQRIVRVVVRRGAARSRWIQWGGWALAASAAALLLVIRSPVRPPVPEPPRRPSAAVGETGSPSPPGVRPAPPEAPLPPGTSGLRLLPAVVPQVSTILRGGGGNESIATTRIDPGTRILVLPAMSEALPDMPETTRVRVELIAPSGRVLLGETLPLRRLRDERVLVYELGHDPLEPGVYHLRLRTAGEPVVATFRLESAATKTR